MTVSGGPRRAGRSFAEGPVTVAKDGVRPRGAGGRLRRPVAGQAPSAPKKETVFETEWFNVEEEVFPGLRGLGGKPYYRINAPDGVLVLAMTARQELILVKQFRPALNRFTLELPCGSCGHSEPPERAARRELYEETGYRCDTLELLGAGRVTMNRINSQEYAFFGPAAVRDPRFKPKEDIDVVLASLDEFKSLVCSGQFEQLVALGLFVLAEWRLGTKLVTAPKRGTPAPCPEVRRPVDHAPHLGYAGPGMEGGQCEGSRTPHGARTKWI